MTTAIEQYLFKWDEPSAVVAVALVEKQILISIAPWEQLSLAVSAQFEEAMITSLEVYADSPDDLNLPWDIIGFDSYPLPDERWRFVLHCIGIEYVFEARWPRLLIEPK
jgi:hypothetical protein